MNVWGWITKLWRKPEPPKKRSRRKVPKRLSRADVQALLDAPDLGSATGLRDRCMMELMYRAGLRVSEVVKLMPRDVEPEGIVRVWQGKGGVDRTAYFDPSRVWPLVSQWSSRRDSFARPESPLFCGLRGQQLTTRFVQQSVSRYRREAGITAHATPHTLRHSFASELLEEGFDLRQVQTLLGHANVATTEIYTHISDVRLQRQVGDRT